MNIFARYWHRFEALIPRGGFFHSEPGDLWFASAVTLANGVYIVGLGWTEPHSEPGHSYMHLPEGSTKWITNQLGSDNTPGVGGGACAVAISPYQFLVIGGAGKESAQVLKYDEGAWAVWPPLSKRWVGHACAKLGNEIIISGGVDDDGLDAIQTTTILNISTRKERRGGNMIMGRAGFGMAIVNNKLVVFGGGNGNMFLPGGSDLAMTDTIEEWNEDKETWSLREDRMQTPRGGLGYTAGPTSSFCG